MPLLLLRGTTNGGLREGIEMVAMVWRCSTQTLLGSERPGIPSESTEMQGGGEVQGVWELDVTSAPAPPHPAGGVLWNMMRSWPGSGRPTSTRSTSSWDQGGMSRGLLRRPLTSLLKVGGRGSLCG